LTIDADTLPTDLAWLLRSALRAHRAAIADALARAGHTDLPPLALWAIDALAAAAPASRGHA